MKALGAGTVYSLDAEVLYCPLEEGGVLTMPNMSLCTLFKSAWSLSKDLFLEFGVLAFVTVNIKGCSFSPMVTGLVGSRDLLVLFALLLLLESLRLLTAVLDFAAFSLLQFTGVLKFTFLWSSLFSLLDSGD